MLVFLISLLILTSCGIWFVGWYYRNEEWY